MGKVVTVTLLKRWPLALIACALVLASTAGGAVLAQTATCSASDQTLPGGEVANDEDPHVPTYCLPAAPVHAPTRITGANDWVDSFVQDAAGPFRFDDGDMDYRQFQVGNIGRTRHLLVGDHWINDQEIRYAGGVMMRPNRSFHAEGNKLVVEADVSAGTNAWSGNAWPEIVVSTTDRPDVFPPDDPEQNYAYGHTHGFPTFGCRLQDGGTFTCATFTGNGLGQTPNTSDTAPCYSLQSDRLWELSFFQACGSYFGGVHFGGTPNDAAPGTNQLLGHWFRQCAPTDAYDHCMDRIRVEITPTSMVWFVNGQRYFEDSGWDSLHQIPQALFTQPVYVYFADFNFIDPRYKAFRFHWERLAVNPHQANGSFTAPSATQDFLDAQGTPPGPTATPVPPAATSTPTPPAGQPTATSTPRPTNTAVPTSTAVAPPHCRVRASVDGKPEVWRTITDPALAAAICG